MSAAHRPVTLLVAALGGEGGGVLSKWIVDAAESQGHWVQSTSVPGVAQRTGATTYYVEILPRPEGAGGDEAADRRPVLALTPSPGGVDAVVASELVEAGRAMQNGFVSPWRTTLVASTHRVYAIAEKSALADGRYDGRRIRAAASKLAARAVLADMSALARAAGSASNAVLLGALAASGAVPVPRAAFEAAIVRSGIAVEANLRGFAAGCAAAVGELGPDASERAAAPRRRAERNRTDIGDLERRVEADFPDAVRKLLKIGVRRLVDYQDAAYAETYLLHLARLLDADRAAGGAARGYRLTLEAGRRLALWMSFEDVIRVADLKTRPARLARVRREAGARPGEPVVISEYLKPGIDEWCALLPPLLARPLRSFAERGGRTARLQFGIRLKTTTVAGFLALRFVALLRRWRRRTLRYREEQARIRAWLERVTALAPANYDLALELIACAGVVKGYGETRRRGAGRFDRILESLPALGVGPEAPARLARLREAALADEEGEALARAFEALAAPARTADPGAVPAAADPEGRSRPGDEFAFCRPLKARHPVIR